MRIYRVKDTVPWPCFRSCACLRAVLSVRAATSLHSDSKTHQVHIILLKRLAQKPSKASAVCELAAVFYRGVIHVALLLCRLAVGFGELRAWRGDGLRRWGLANQTRSPPVCSPPIAEELTVCFRASSRDATLPIQFTMAKIKFHLKKYR